MNLATGIVLLVLLGAVAAALVSLIKKHKASGGVSCSCGCSCDSANTCSRNSSCSLQHKEQ